MSDCVCLPKCLFFNDKMANMPALADIMKKRYCLGAGVDCARFKVFSALGSEKVPTDLFPSQMDRALEIIKAD